ncbi:MAG TPA: DUF2089 family protein [Gemmataceae bacterium]|nr:DUF2089 family protein [Gemmataceae bacterium]
MTDGFFQSSSPLGKRPAWLEALDEEDMQFLKRFLLASGSLKALADAYGISYPTVRARLDRLIAKVQAAEDAKVTDPFERKLRILVADAKVPVSLAKELLEAHRDSLRRRNVE